MVTFLLKQCDPAINTFFYNGCVVYGRREFLNRVINCSLTCLTTSAAPHPGHLSSVRRLTTAHRPLSSPPPPQPPPTTLNLTPPPTCGSHRHPCQPCAGESCANVAVLVCRLIPDTSLMFGVARIILRDYHLCLNFVTMVTKVTAATRIVVQHNVLAMYSLGTKYSAAMLLIIKNVSYRMTNIIAPHTHAHEKAVVYPFVTWLCAFIKRLQLCYCIYNRSLAIWWCQWWRMIITRLLYALQSQYNLALIAMSDAIT